MPAAEVLIIEQTGLWLARIRQAEELLRAECGPEPLALRRVPSWESAAVRLRDRPHSTLIVELRRDNLDDALDALWRCHVEHPRALTAAVTDRSLAAWEWLARELGAAAFFASPRDLRPLVRALVRQRALSTAAPEDLFASVWAELPWGE